jgi:hypothetical protein
MLAIGLIALLVADSGVQAAMGPRLLPDGTKDNATGIFPDYIPEGALLPLIVYGFSYEENEMTLDGPDPLTQAQLEFIVQGNSYIQAKKVAIAMRVAFQNFQGTLTDGSEVDTIHRISELSMFQEAPFLVQISVGFRAVYRDVGS